MRNMEGGRVSERDIEKQKENENGFDKCRLVTKLEFFAV